MHHQYRQPTLQKQCFPVGDLSQLKKGFPKRALAMALIQHLPP
jgi:hypothetical protein